MRKLVKSVFIVLLLFTTCKKGSKGPVEVIPLAPSNLSASLTSSTQVNLSWTDNSTNETGFKIERKTSGGVYQIIATTGADITSFTDNLPTNSSYSYRVYSYNSAGNSLAYSNEQSINNSLPMITTTGVSQITGISGSSGGEIASNGGSDIIARGVVWSISPNPTVSLSTKTVDGSGLGSFTSKLTGLGLNTTYYLRAYATNSAGTAYGNEISFTTLNVDIITGLVAYFPFNGDAKDESGNGNHGTVVGAVLTKDRFGNFDKAFSFGNNSIQVANSSTLNPSNITISLWLKSSGKNRCILAKNNPNNATSVSYSLTIDDFWVEQRGFGIRYGNGQCFTSSNYSYWGPQGGISDNIWTHLAVTIKYDGTVVCYRDGDVWYNYVGPAYFPCNDSSSVLKIGGPFWNNDTEYFVGSLDEIRIYNRILTAQEISYLSKN